MLIFDLGCNRGNFTAACKERWPNAQIVAVDANIKMQEYMYARFGRGTIQFVCCLISDKEGQEDFFISPEDGISTASRDWMTKSRFGSGSKYISLPSNWVLQEQRVHSLTIDNLIEVFGKPDFIKVDLEGYELKAILGLSQYVSEICFEWTEEEMDNSVAAVEHLKSLGYEEFGLKGHFDAGVPVNATEAPNGDDYLLFPSYYGSWETLGFEKSCDPGRKVNWGMIHARHRQ